MNEDNIIKHLSVMAFMDSSKLNMLLSTKSAGSQNDYLKEHRWYKINNMNMAALAYEDNGRYFYSKVHLIKDSDDNMGINSVDAYGGQSKKRGKNNPKNNKLVNANPSGNGRRKKNVKKAANSTDDSDHNTNLMGEYNDEKNE
ncbi:hypothetical protein AMV098 [Betaentomopoxvirus amoorei]|uniref:AMV098 n=1 Tax=Amsacta moorei entomopoxvirus TaxID=28321 RepID=Q9EMV1_AMEPV|nr:hypothetical protein AMV098 [Amsacta moorei entomopoxvirus]AAG02804.1 AMV098 [Amsacta moorei entomopoxvirus]